VRRTRISSEAIASVGYDVPARILEVEFISGEVYRYFDVAQGEVDGLFRADSRGAYLNDRIKPRHRYVHVTV
jgi:hypothetical protein